MTWDSVLKIVGVAIALAGFLVTLGWNIYNAVIGQQKALSEIRVEAAKAKADIGKDLTDAKEKLEAEVEHQIDRIRTEVAASSNAARADTAKLRLDFDEYRRHDELAHSDMRERTVTLETKMGPFWRMVERSIFPRVNVPEDDSR